MIGLLILLVVGAGFALWDRSSPVSTTPDMRLVWVGGALAVLGALSTFMAWWAIVPVIVLIAGASLVVVGRHRVRIAS